MDLSAKKNLCASSVRSVPLRGFAPSRELVISALLDPCLQHDRLPCKPSRPDGPAHGHRPRAAAGTRGAGCNHGRWAYSLQS
ncbi:MAG: hypothetical protein JW999_05995 [Methanotrichaceae archaeon]|nr:hypothetical protein [Methanotrichaceae archaeon]